MNIDSWCGAGSAAINAAYAVSIPIALFSTSSMAIFVLGLSGRSLDSLKKIADAWRLPSIDCAQIKQGQPDIVGPGVRSPEIGT
jgi:hypothetical protein